MKRELKELWYNDETGGLAGLILWFIILPGLAFFIGWLAS